MPQHGSDLPVLFDLEEEAQSLLMTAEWRRHKAEEYPDDERNLQAAALLEKLAAGMTALSGSIAHVKLDARLQGHDLHGFCEASSEYRRRIGFSEFPTSPQEYLEHLAAL